MEDKVENAIHRLYDIAEIAYHAQYSHDAPIIIADGKEWVMLKSDYDMIEYVKKILEDYEYRGLGDIEY